jgi:3-methyladenine DNA glycosylase AlkC
LFDKHWEALELKQRIRQISVVLRQHLPHHYPSALEIMVRVTQHYLHTHGEKLTFEYTFIPDFVETHGVDFPDQSIPALETMTQWSSAEFAVRPFLIKYPERMYGQMLAWSKHPSAMVRRLSSEGIRPRLPWGMGVPALKREPAPILPVLENLKNDPAETVRRSVANNLNDIAKEHPQLVLALVGRWQGLSAETDWVLRHACRGLLKKGNADALAYFGFNHAVEGMEVSELQCDAQVAIGSYLHFSFLLRNHSANAAQIRVEYGIEFQTLSGKTSYKVFKIKEIELEAGQQVPVIRRQSFSDFTTRKHYAGPHRLKILINGKSREEALFMVE